MTKGLRFWKVAICLAAAIVAVPACFAQATPILAAGSTGAFNAMGLGGVNAINPVTITAVTANSPVAGEATATCATSCASFTTGKISIVGTGTSATNPQFDATNVTVVSASAGSFVFDSTNSTNFSGTAFAGETPTCSNLPFSSTTDTTSVGTSNTTFNWSQTGKSGHQYLQGLDSRNASFVAQNAKAWVEWQTNNPWDGTISQAGTSVTAVCEYLAVDSIVGLRLFFATNSAGTPAGTISFPGACAATITGDQQVPLLPTDTALPTQVCSVINGLPFNAAPTDVAAEDGAYQMGIICGTYSAGGTGYGLSCGRGGGTATNIESGISGGASAVQAVDFNIGGTDPVTAAKIAHSTAGVDGHPWVHLNGGGQAILVLVNTSDTTSNGLGNAALTDIKMSTLDRVYTGNITRTRDLFANQGLASKALTVLVREPLSGTYTTFQNQVGRTAEYLHSIDQLANNGGTPQQFGVGMVSTTGWTFGGAGIPTATTDQLDAKKTSTGGLKVRVIGTGEMVACVAATSKCGDGTEKDVAGNALSNQIGFTFFSFGNVAPCTTGPTCKYLTVNEADPLYANSSSNPGGAGFLPTCANPCAGAVSLPNIVNGSYPIWNILRIVTTGPLGAYTGTAQNPTCMTGATVCQMVQQMQASYSLIPDLVPISSMQAFRQHTTVASSTPETGGDNYTAHDGYKHYGAGITGTPCGFAPVTGATVQYECGRDAEGAKQNIQEELDSDTDYNLELTAAEQ